jgi:hypothetical protein
VATELRNSWKEKTQEKAQGNGHEYPLLPRKRGREAFPGKRGNHGITLRGSRERF